MIKINPTNNSQLLKVEKAGRGKIQLTAVFGNHEEVVAVISKSLLLKSLVTRDTRLTDFDDSALKRVVVDGTETRLFFKPNPTCDLIVVNTNELKRAVRNVR